jgi:dihydroorotate dehydrogenase (NAD+) catalytic subunit
MLFISPPFGNYYNFQNPNVLSIKGSFTLNPRPNNASYFEYVGSLCGQFFRTFRYNFKYSGFVNKIGLRNRGIQYAIDKYYTPYQKTQQKTPPDIISIAIMDETDIEELNKIVPRNCNIELNVSCPNVDKPDDYKRNVYKKLHVFVDDRRTWCIVKVSLKDKIEHIDTLVEAGITQIHTTNTWSLEDGSGGLSGPYLRERNVPFIRHIRDKYPELTIIGGGGIRGIKDVNEYEKAGANHFAISTVICNPLLFYYVYRDIMSKFDI